MQQGGIDESARTRAECPLEPTPPSPGLAVGWVWFRQIGVDAPQWRNDLAGSTPSPSWACGIFLDSFDLMFAHAKPRISTRFTYPRGACPHSALNCNINYSPPRHPRETGPKLCRLHSTGLGFPGGRQIPCSGIRIPCSGSNSALKFPARLRREFCKKTMQYQRISHIPFA